MSKADAKLQQSSKEEDNAVSDQDLLYLNHDDSRFQNLHQCEQEKPTPTPEENLESRITASPSLLQLKDQWKSCKDLQIILLRSKKISTRTTEDLRDTKRYTSTLSIQLPSRRNKKYSGDEDKLQTTTTDIDKTYTAYQQNTEIKDVFPPKDQGCRSAGQWFKNGNSEKASVNEDIPQLGVNITKHGQNTGKWNKSNLHKRTKIDIKNSKTPLAQEVLTKIKKEPSENKATIPQTHNSQHSGLKTNTSTQSFANHPEPHSDPCLVNPASTMLTSALTTVLVPPRSGHLRRPKQSIGGVENEGHDQGQKDNPSTLFLHNQQQQTSLPLQRQPSEHILINDNEIQLSSKTSYCPDWQKENNSPNIKSRTQTQKSIFKSSSMGSMYKTELHNLPSSVDNREVANLSYPGFKMIKTGDEPFKSLSSKPTTSSLLLSLRRSNLRNLNAASKQTQTTRSVRSLTLPCRNTFKTHSFGYSVPNNNELKVGTEEMVDTHFRFTPRIKSRVPLKIPPCLDKPETDNSVRQELSATRAYNQHIQPSLSRISHLDACNGEQSSYLTLLKKYSSKVSNDPMQEHSGKMSHQQTSNITKQVNKTTMISLNDSTKLNTPPSTYTDRLNLSPRKDSVVDGVSPTNMGKIYLDSKENSQSSPTSMDLSSPPSPSRSLGGVRVPSIYAYLRESSTSLSIPSVERPVKQGGCSALAGEQKTVPSKFTFDFIPSGSHEHPFTKSSCGSSTCLTPTQSLPTDLRRASAPRLSTSPYSSLISSRPALSNTLQSLSVPSVSKTHTQSTSHDIVTTHTDLVDPSSSSTCTSSRSIDKSVSSDGEKRTAVQDYKSALKNHKPAQPWLPQTAPTLVMESQSAYRSQREPDIDCNVIHQEHSDLSAHQLEDGNANIVHKLSDVEKCFIPHRLKVESETVLGGKLETRCGHIQENWQEIQSSRSEKKRLTSEEKNDIFSSTVLDKGVVGIQYLKTKRQLPVFKPSSRIDQMLTRLKLTFGVKCSDVTDMKDNRALVYQSSANETYVRQENVEKGYSGGQQGPHKLSTDKESLYSLTSLDTPEHALSLVGISKSKADVKNSSSSLMDKGYFESPSPAAIRKSTNVDWQNKTTKQNRSESTFEPAITSFSTDEVQSHLQSRTPLENQLSAGQEKKDADENGNLSYYGDFSHRRLKDQGIKCSATLPRCKKSSVTSSSSNVWVDYDSEDPQNDNVFYSPVFKKTDSLCESDDFPTLSSAKGSLNLVRSRLSSSCADLKYGLPSGRSFSVTGMVSSRPSGPGRISTSSISDLSSLDDCVPRGSNTSVDSHCMSHDANSGNGQLPQLEHTGDHLEDDFKDPTPPLSPSLSPRRISQARAISSPIRPTPENLSPLHGVLPPRNYITSVLDESGSDTTTDDEYYLGNGDDGDLETEL